MLRNMALMVGMVNLATSAAFTLLVLFAVGAGSPLGLTEPQFGVLLALVASGGMAGGFLAEPIQRRLGRSRALTAAVLGVTATVAAPALTTDVAAIATVFFVGGVAVMVWNIITVSYRQRITPDHLLGRVNSAYRLVAWGTRPLGAGLGGALGEWLGVRPVFAVMGLVALAVLVPDRSITEADLA